MKTHYRYIPFYQTEFFQDSCHLLPIGVGNFEAQFTIFLILVPENKGDGNELLSD